MLVDTNTKVIVLPAEFTDFQIASLPNPANLSQKSTFLLADGAPAGGAKQHFFELREINGANPYSTNNVTLPKTTDAAVKSWILEPSPSSSAAVVAPSPSASGASGYVLQSPNLIVSSKFNPAYILISILHTNSALTKRFLTVEDFVDSITAAYSEEAWVPLIKETSYADALQLICETIVENDETFYKYSPAVAYAWLDDKVSRLAAHLLQQATEVASSSAAALQIVQHIKGKLYESTQVDTKIPGDVLASAIEKHAVDLILGSYCLPEVYDAFVQEKGYDFAKYDNYLKDLEQKRRDLAVVEQNMQTIVESSAKASASAKVQKKKVDAKKKVVKKVAVGKGALDGFFKKAAA